MCETVYACFDAVDEPLCDLTNFILMNGTMMRSMDARETEIDLRDAGDGEDDEGLQTWKTQLETVPEEEEEEEDVISTQSDTRPLINERDPRQINECLKVIFSCPTAIVLHCSTIEMSLLMITATSGNFSFPIGRLNFSNSPFPSKSIMIIGVFFRYYLTTF